MTPNESLRAEACAWFEEHWDPQLTLAAWWGRLFEGRWTAPTWPKKWYGRGLSGGEARIVREERERAGGAAGPGGLGMMLAGPTILAHGTPEQKRRYLPGILKGEMAWCQLFSEPAAGSDLAGLQTRATRDGGGWAVSGQKVWSSGAQHADLGMLLARTDVTVPKHRGITYFVIEMDQPGIETRPIREMTGRALFSEVFLDEAQVRDDATIGEIGSGWAVANTTLTAERSGLAGESEAGGGILPGRKAGMLGREAGGAVGRSRDRSGTATLVSGRVSEELIRLSQERGRHSDPMIRQGLAQLWMLERISRYTSLRARSAVRAGRPPGPEVSTQKLGMSRTVRLSREMGLAVIGADGLLYGPGAPTGGMLQELALFSPAPSIYGGSDEIQRNIIGERVLDLPREPTL